MENYPKYLSSQIGKNPQMKAVLIFLHFPVISSVGSLSYAEPAISLFLFILLQDSTPKVEL